MKKQVDYFIKDEGDFFTFGFISDKAKELINSQIKTNPGLKPSITVQNDDVVKLDILIEFKNNMIAWAVSHNLYGEEC